MVLEKTLESPLDCKEIHQVHSEGDQPWDFFGRNDAKAETPILWPPHEKSWLIGKDSDAGRDWGQKEKGTTDDEMAGWHHWLDGRESEWTLGVGDGQGGLVCCDSWGHKESDTTERLNWTELNPVCSICRLLFMMDYFLMFLTMLSTLGGLDLYPMGVLGSGNMTRMLLLFFFVVIVPWGAWESITRHENFIT